MSDGACKCGGGCGGGGGGLGAIPDCGCVPLGFWEDESASEGPVVVDPEVVEILMRGLGRQGLGEVVTVSAILVAAAAAAVARYGPGVVDWAVDGFESFFGINSCSDANKKKHRKRIEALIATGADGLRVLSEGIAQGKMTGATGECLKYALKWAAARVIELSREQGLALDEVKAAKPDQGRAAAEAVVAQPHASGTVCSEAIRAHFVARGGGSIHAGDRALYGEMSRRCRERYAPAADTCPPTPREWGLVGGDRASWCAASEAQGEAVVAMVRAAKLTAEQEAELLALPHTQRAARFKVIVEDAAGVPFLVWLVLTGLALGLVALVFKAFGGKK